MTKLNQIEAIPFDPSHVAVMNLRLHELESMSADSIKKLAYSTDCKTYMIDGRILCVAGYHQLWEGVREVYVLPSIYVSEYALQFQRAVKATLDQWMTESHRLQTVSIADDPTDLWMESLGFHAEGTLVKYMSNGLDYRMWARLT